MTLRLVSLNLYVSVDPKTEWPVEMVLTGTTAGTKEIKAWYRWQEIRWNESLDPTLFEPHVPEGCKVIEGPPPERPLWPDLEKRLRPG